MSDPNPSQPVWQIESTDPKIAGDLKEHLRQIVDPEIGLDIIALGLVRDIKVKDDEAQVKMILTTPFCPYGPAILETTRQKTEEFLEKPTTIEMGMEMWDFSFMEEGAGADWGLY